MTGVRLRSSKALQGPRGTNCSWPAQPASKLDTVYKQPTRPAQGVLLLKSTKCATMRSTFYGDIDG